jgi:hypothetical protein
MSPGEFGCQCKTAGEFLSSVAANADQTTLDVKVLL